MFAKLSESVGHIEKEGEERGRVSMIGRRITAVFICDMLGCLLSLSRFRRVVCSSLVKLNMCKRCDRFLETIPHLRCRPIPKWVRALAITLGIAVGSMRD